MKNITPHVLSAIFKHLKSRPTFESVGIKEYRTLLDQSARAFRPDPGVEFTPFTLKHMDAAWLTPETPDPRTVILYVHGGGYIAGSIKSHRDLASRIARASNMRTLIFEYRLAPEHPYPGGLDDVCLAFEFLKEYHTGKGQRPLRIVVAGDSAGGGLSLALLARLDRTNAPLPACAVLMSPWIDLTCTNPSQIGNRDKDPMLSQSVLKKTARLYTDSALDNPEISPVRHPFKTMCPLLVHVGENEVLLDDSKTLAGNISSIGAGVELDIYEEMFHVWHYFARYLPQGREAIDRIGVFIRSHA